MTTNIMRLESYARGEWLRGTGAATPLMHAVTGETIAEASSTGLDFAGMAEYARTVGGPALRRLTFHQRALMLKEMAKYLTDRKEGLYRLSAATGATKADSWIDIDGGIGTFFVYASKGRRELPNETFYVDGPMEALSKGGPLLGGHLALRPAASRMAPNGSIFAGGGCFVSLGRRRPPGTPRWGRR